MATSVPLVKIDTEYSADAVEWCPTSAEPLLACATYQLAAAEQEQEQEQEQEKSSTTKATQEDSDDETEKRTPPRARLGRLLLYRLETGAAAAADGETTTLRDAGLNSSNIRLVEVLRRDMPAILDIKWLPRTIANSDPVLAIVDASGFLTLYRVGMSAKSVTLEVLCQSNAVSDTLRLSLEWNCRIDASSPLQIASSDSAGQIALHQFAEGEVALVQEWEAHSFEAWITAFNQWNTSTVYSGGDDSLFRGWDTRTDCTTPIFTSKRHTMGVCSLQSHPSREHILASGSYDEHIRLWDTRSMRAPVEDIRVHGGVWRLKWQAQNPSLIAAAAMHGGVPVVSVDESNKPSLTHRHTAHESIAYGVDWHPQIEGLIASCSFYDHSLHLWRLPTNADMP